MAWLCPVSVIKIVLMIKLIKLFDLISILQHFIKEDTEQDKRVKHMRKRVN